MHTRPDHRISSRPLPPVAALGIATAALAASLLPLNAHALVNVSGIVTGTQTQPPVIWAGSVQAPCSSACVYAVGSSAGQTDSHTTYPSPFLTPAWPPSFTVSGGPLRPASVTDLGTVAPAAAGVVQDGGSVIGVQQRARVSFPMMWMPGGSGDWSMTTQTWKTGSGAAVVSHAIRLTTPAVMAKHTYVEFDVPSLMRGWQYAYDVGGPSGYQPITTNPHRFQSRVAMDIYVDGLPVWTAQSHLLHPDAWTPPNHTPHVVNWGAALDGAADTTLYLGQLPAGSTRTITVVMRSDLRTEAPTCKTDSAYGTTYQRCHSMREGMSLPMGFVNIGGFLSARPKFRVYTY